MKKLGILGIALLLAIAILAFGCKSGESAGGSGSGGTTKGVYANLDPNRTYYLCSSHQAHT